MKWNFSIILASRERINLLDGLLQSIQNNTHDLNQVEVIVMVDEDDLPTLEYIADCRDSFPFVRFYARSRAKNLNDDYLNFAWRNYASGRFCIVCNDDCLFSVNGWDSLALAELEDYLADKPDGIVYGWIEDSLLNRDRVLNYCCFPLISAAAAQCLGWLMPPMFTSWSADIAVFMVYSGVGRVVELPFKIDHVSHYNGLRQRDHISFHCEELDKHGEDLHNFKPLPFIEKLKERINESS